MNSISSSDDLSNIVGDLKKQLGLFAEYVENRDFESENLKVLVCSLEDKLDFLSELNLDKSNHNDSYLSEEKISGMLMDNHPDVAFLLDTQGRVLFCNKKAKDLFNITPERIIGNFIFDYIYKEDVDSKKNILKKVTASGIPQIFEYVIDGMDFSVNLFPIFSESKKVDFIALFAWDITRLKVTHSRLRRQRDEYQTIFNSVESMIFYKDTDLKLIRVNRSALENTGYSKADIIGKKPEEIFPKEGKEFRDSDLEVIEKGKAIVGTIEKYSTVSGEERWTKTDKYPYLDENGKICGVIVFSKDVTYKKKAEETEKRLIKELKDKSKIMNAILSSSPDVFCMFDRDDICTYINANGAKKMGVESPDELINRPLEEMGFPIALTDEVSKFNEAVFETGIPISTETSIPTKRGILNYKYTITPIYNEKDQITSVVITASDITSTKEIQKSLEESHARYRSLFKDNHAIMLLIDPLNGEIVDANNAACEFYGYSRRELLSTNITDIRIAKKKETFDKMNDACTVKSRRFFSRHMLNNGEVRDVESYVGTISFGEKLLIYDIVHDISEKIHAQILVDETLKKLEKALDNTIHVISKVSETKDPYTAGHQKRVSILAVEIAKELGLDLERTYKIKVASLLHDIGKIGIPTDLLSKPGKLSDVELSLIKQHCEIGSDIVFGLEFPWGVNDVVLQHHERLDGSGYPKGLKGEEITLPARIVAVADVVEAMASHRPYRPALGTEAALAEIKKNSGKLYDEKVVESCCNLFKRGFSFD